MLVAAIAVSACSEAADDSRLAASQLTASVEPHTEIDASSEQNRLGLMTGLPLYWPLGVDFGTLAQGNAPVPWQRTALERDYRLVLLDTLSPVAGLTEGTPDTDPLAGLDRIAVIQPRGLSPADNAALDAWVRVGGELLLVLDPALTGHYPLALGDPRRPNAVAIIPPVVERWGLKMQFDDRQPPMRTVELENSDLSVSLSGEFEKIPGDAPGSDCTLMADGIAARCTIGKGRATLIADAAAFETGHQEPGAQVGPDRHDENDTSRARNPGADIATLLDFAFGGSGDTTSDR
ncbi:MAG: hypothetical protein WA936_12255 [Erythrobacter sp.]|uniref:hypothetical protein n=1 Tax=Erythrobacter sp. TaxID=1042 RepID=UPI003C75233C